MERVDPREPELQESPDAEFHSRGALSPAPGAMFLMAKTRKILLIEDGFDMRELRGELLASRGFQAAPASDGYEAVAKIEKATFDLVITDIRLPL